MWFKEYRDYPNDCSLVKEKVEPGKGIIGCEMHDLNGWGTSLHRHKHPKNGLWGKFISLFFKKTTNNFK